MSEQSEPVTSGRPGVSYDEVSSAMAQLKAEGRKASLREIRTRLGKGSFATITKHRQSALEEQIREKQTLDDPEAQALEEKIRAIAVELHSALSVDLSQWADKAIADKEQEVAQLRDKANQQIAEADTRTHLAEEKYTALTASLSDALEQRDEALNDSRQLRISLDTVKDENSASQANYSRLIADLETQAAQDRQSYEELAREHDKQLREHAEAKANWDKDRLERDNLMSISSKTIKDVEARLVAAEINNRSLKITLDSKLSEMETHKGLLETYRSDADTARTKVDELQQENSQLHKSNATLTAEVQHQLPTLTARIKEKDRLIQALEDKISALEKSKASVPKNKKK